MYAPLAAAAAAALQPQRFSLSASASGVQRGRLDDPARQWTR